MKKVLMLMLGLVAGTVSFANPTIPPSATQTHLTMTPEHKIRLYVQPLQTTGQLAIRNDKGQAVYARNVALGKGYSQQFDVSGLSNGTYQLTLKTGSETVTRTFVMQANPNESFIVQ